MKGCVSCLVLALLLTNVLTKVPKVQPISAIGTIYIRADGSMDPTTAPISTIDNVTYTLTGNITSDFTGIVVERYNIVFDGSGFLIQGQGTSDFNGIYLNQRNNVTIERTTTDISGKASIWTILSRAPFPTTR